MVWFEDLATRRESSRPIVAFVQNSCNEALGGGFGTGLDISACIKLNLMADKSMGSFAGLDSLPAEAPDNWGAVGVCIFALL